MFVVSEEAAAIADAVESSPIVDEAVSAIPRVADEVVTEDDSAGDNEFKPITSQDAFENALKTRLERAQRSAEKKYAKQMEELSSKIKEYETAQLSDQEKKDLRLSELEANLQEATDRYTKLERTRLVETLARDMGLPEKFWSRVQGSSDDEIISDINDMLEGIPRTERRDAVLSQSPTMSVQSTGTDPEIEENPKVIAEKLSSLFSF